MKIVGAKVIISPKRLQKNTPRDILYVPNNFIVFFSAYFLCLFLRIIFLYEQIIIGRNLPFIFVRMLMRYYKVVWRR